jgi:tripartite-type tricarboxylate transporter receptor subunit TctC
MKIVRFAACALLAAAAPFGALAQDKYPSKPVRIIVPFSAGSGTDIVARLFGEHMTKLTGQGFVVDNRQGADGIIGAEMIAKAAPDGYTLGVVPASPMTMNPALYPLPYDPIKDYVAVANFASLGFVLAVNPSVPVKNVRELIAYAKANPGKLNYAAGSTVVHIAGEWFKIATGTNIVAIPYKGTAPQVTAVLANEVAMTFDPYLGFAHMKAGRIRPLAVTSAKRSSALPDVPTLDESGVKGLVVETWIGLFAPAATPRPVIDLLQREAVRMVGLPEIKERLAGLSYEPVGTTGEQFSAQIAADIGRWAKMIKETGFKVTK